MVMAGEGYLDSIGGEEGSQDLLRRIVPMFLPRAEERRVEEYEDIANGRILPRGGEIGAKEIELVDVRVVRVVRRFPALPAQLEIELVVVDSQHDEVRFTIVEGVVHVLRINRRRGGRTGERVE